MTNQIAARLDRLTAAISAACGRPVELTIRGERKFTFSTDEVTPDLADKLAAYFGAAVKAIEASHDDECGTFVYVTL